MKNSSEAIRYLGTDPDAPCDAYAAWFLDYCAPVDPVVDAHADTVLATAKTVLEKSKKAD